MSEHEIIGTEVANEVLADTVTAQGYAVISVE